MSTRFPRPLSFQRFQLSFQRFQRLGSASALLLAIATGCSVHSHVESTQIAGYQSDVSTVQVISALVGGKNVFIPSTIVVASGKATTLSVFNTTDTPHGFAIKAIGIESVLMPAEETAIELPSLEGGAIYTIGCQLHPPHRTATLVVVPGR